MMALSGSGVVTYNETDPITKTYNDTLTPGYYFEQIDIPEQDAGANVEFDFTLNVNTGGDTKDIYFIYTNTSPYSASSYPVVGEPSPSVSEETTPETPVPAKPMLARAAYQRLRGKPEISEFNRMPYLYLNSINPVNMLLDYVSSSEPKYDLTGDSKLFRIDPYSSIDAQCIAQNSDGARTLNVWVADNCTGLSYAKSISYLADTFLQSGDNNDIYDWVSTIYGVEWGGSQWPSLSAETTKVLIAPNNEITILLLDIDGDRSTTSGVLGYFWAKDNFKKSAISYSNERIMFYIDAYFYSKYPDEVISALAHELQHMIHFYQKTVVRTNGTGTETWIDEMCSMATEDLVAEKLQVDGPRGVSYLLGTAGASGNTEGRLPLYNYFNDASVTTWYSGSYTIVSYALNYALGAYLSRNYGGAQFFRDVMQNKFTNYKAIEYALNKYDPTLTSGSFGTILSRWGVANILSDKTDAPDGYMYNTGGWAASSINTIDYYLGSINLYNYTYPFSSPQQVGPYFFEGTTMPSGTMPGASNEYYKAAKNFNGSKTWHIKLRKNVRLTIVAK